MWCPKCNVEYREGFTVCSDCGSDLVEAHPHDNDGLPTTSSRNKRSPILWLVLVAALLLVAGVERFYRFPDASARGIALFDSSSSEGASRSEELPDDPAKPPAQIEPVTQNIGITAALQQYMEQGEAPTGALERAQTMSLKRTITVQKGDNLWKIARDVYGEQAYHSHIYDANRDTIGDDPDVIDVGQVLVIPYVIGDQPYIFEPKLLPDANLTMRLPSSFTDISEDAVIEAIFAHSNDHSVFSDEDSQVGLTVSLIDEVLTTDNIFAFALLQKDTLTEKYPAISFPSGADAVSRGETKTAYFDYILQEDGVDTYHLVFLTPVVNKVLAGVFRCPAEDSEDWRPVMCEMMRSIPEPETPKQQWSRGPINNVGHTGEWLIDVWGNKKSGGGLGGMPWSSTFYDDYSSPRASTLLTAALPVTEAMQSFYQDWPATVEVMTKTLLEMAGEDVVRSIHADEIHSPDGNTYVFSFELRYVPVTMSWRFCKSYYLFAMGVDLGDMPDMAEITIDAARNFKDYSSSPLSGYQVTYYDGRPAADVPKWSYPVHNPFWPLWEYFYEEGGAFNPEEIIPEEPIALETPYDWGDQALVPADEAIPAAKLFWERYETAAEALGVSIKKDGAKHANTINADGIDVGAIYYDPSHIMMMMYGQSEQERLLFYGATAAAITGLPADEALHAMTDLVYHAQSNVWSNGNHVYENTKVLAGVPFNYYISPRDNAPWIGVLGVNYDEHRRLVEQEAEE